MTALLTTIFFSTITLLHPSDSTKALVNKLEKYNSTHITEKVHLHTDRPRYIVGDTIWFNAYAATQELNYNKKLSKYLYVDLLKGDTVKQSIKLRLKNGTAPGDMILDEEWTGGIYRLRAYTNWMRNSGPESYFEKIIAVNDLDYINQGSAWNIKQKEKKHNDSSPSVQFFPESGVMLNGVLSKVGFKVVGVDGLSRDATGYLSDEQGHRLIDLKTDYAGMGNFSFIPYKGLKYAAVLNFIDGTQKSYPLPPSMERGYTLSVNNSRADRIIINVSASTTFLEKDPNLSLLGVYNDRVIYQQVVKLDSSGTATLLIAKKNLPEGVLQLSLFDQDMRLQAERLIFMPIKPGLIPTIKANKPVYGKRDRVQLKITTQDSTNNFKALLSMSVIDESAVPFDEDDEVSIYSSLYLKGNVRGYIETPNYYFNNPSPEKYLHLDNLLLTQGWRRYDWNEINSGKSEEQSHWPEMTFSVSGKVTNRWKKPVEGATIIVMPTNAASMIRQGTTNYWGRFNIDLSSFSDTTNFIVQAQSPKGAGEAFLELDAIAVEDADKSIYPSSVVNSLEAKLNSLKTPEAIRNARISNLKTGVVLKTVAIKQKTTSKRYIPEKSWNLNGAGNADKVVSNEKLLNYGTLENALYAYVRGYKGDLLQYSRGQELPLGLYIDGSPVTGEIAVATLSSYTLDEIESIEVINAGSTYSLVYGSLSGRLLVNTKGGKWGIKRKYTPGLTYFTPKKAYPNKQFYSPTYDDIRTEEISDRRKTIYWNPEVKLNQHGEAVLNFSTADLPGSYKVVLEGLNGEGLPIRNVLRFETKTK